jgi:hypothetical protein
MSGSKPPALPAGTAEATSNDRIAQKTENDKNTESSQRAPEGGLKNYFVRFGSSNV